MTDTAVSPASPGPDWERAKIVYLPKNLKSIRIVGQDGVNSEYGGEHLDLTPYQTNDMVQVKIYAGRITDIRFPPGMEPAAAEPAQKAKTESSPSKVEPQKPITPPVESPKKLPPRISYIGNGFVVITGTINGDMKFTLVEKALQYIKSFKAGDMVNFSCIGNDKIKSMWKVDENGERPQKSAAYSGQSQPVKPCKTVTIGATINLMNYENIRIEVSGPYETLDDIKSLKAELSQISNLFGVDDQSKQLIQGYSQRVIGK